MLSRWQSTIVDAQGNVQPLANLTVRNEADQSLAKMWASPGTSQPLPDGMVQADGNGYAFFYARGGRYRIQAADLSIDWRHVPLGNAQAADVVGTMSGGSIIERGSNANGEYVKFADGTLICTATLSFNWVGGLSANKIWNFPTPFQSPPSVFATSLGGSQNLSAVFTINNITLIQVTVFATFSVSHSGERPVNLQAIGVWF